MKLSRLWIRFDFKIKGLWGNWHICSAYKMGKTLKNKLTENLNIWIAYKCEWNCCIGLLYLLRPSLIHNIVYYCEERIFQHFCCCSNRLINIYELSGHISPLLLFQEKLEYYISCHLVWCVLVYRVQLSLTSPWASVHWLVQCTLECHWNATGWPS